MSFETFQKAKESNERVMCRAHNFFPFKVDTVSVSVILYVNFRVLCPQFVRLLCAQDKRSGQSLYNHNLVYLMSKNIR